MLIAIDPTAIRAYILAEDRGSENPTTFGIQSLSNKLAAAIKDNLVVFEATAEGSVRVAPGMRFNAFQLFTDVVRLGLKTWNLKYKTATGEVKEAPLIFEKTHHKDYGVNEMVSEASMNYLRPLWVQELATAIVGESFLTGEKEKNSEGP